MFKQAGGGFKLKLRSKLFYTYIIFLLVYAGFTLLPKPSPAILLQYHVSPLWLRIIDLTIILLLAGIWYVGFYGYVKLLEYTRLIESNKDGRQLEKLSKGVFLLVMWLPISSTLSVIFNYAAMRHPGWLSATTITENYINLLLPLVAFVFIGRGAHGLMPIVKQKLTYGAINSLGIVLLYIGFTYYHLVATIPNRHNMYHLHIVLLLITVVVPYVYMWFVGLFAVFELYRYSKKVSGVVYKKSWELLGMGIGWLLILTIVMQYLTTLSAHLVHLSIYWLMVIVYALLLVLSVGFVFIALGANRLRKIEEV